MKVLFVAYGGGHVRMVIPVAQALREVGAEVAILGLTTAAEAVRAAGLPLLQFKDFLEPGDEAARAWGRELLARMPSASVDAEESIAYLGLNFQELAESMGEAAARQAYEEKGRHAFLPERTLERILRRVRPAVLVSTSSPRAEHAAFLAARRLGIPSVCLIDSFLQAEALRLGSPGYADRFCVFNESVRDVLVAAGTPPEAVACTGNPAFDMLRTPEAAAQGAALRQASGWEGKTVVLMPAQHFQPYHPVVGAWEGWDLPQRLQRKLEGWVAATGDAVLCVRPRPDEPEAGASAAPGVVVTGRGWPLAPLLHAVDMVVTVNSTVGLEGHLAGARVIQILGTPFDGSTPWKQFGIADEAVPLEQLEEALEAVRRLPRHPVASAEPATPRVARIVQELAA